MCGSIRYQEYDAWINIQDFCLFQRSYKCDFGMIFGATADIVFRWLAIVERILVQGFKKLFCYLTDEFQNLYCPASVQRGMRVGRGRQAVRGRGRICKYLDHLNYGYCLLRKLVIFSFLLAFLTLTVKLVKIPLKQNFFVI